MPFATRHRADPIPTLAPLAALVVRREEDAAAMAALRRRPEAGMARRLIVRAESADAARLWITSCAPGECRCDHQQPRSGCAA